MTKVLETQDEINEFAVSGDVTVASPVLENAYHITDGEKVKRFEVDQVLVGGLPCTEIVGTEGHIEPTDGTLKFPE